MTTPINKTEELTSTFMRMTMANLPPQSALLWCGGRRIMGPGVAEVECRRPPPLARPGLLHHTALALCLARRAAVTLRMPPSPPACRIHFVFVYIFVAWACQLIVQYSKASVQYTVGMCCWAWRCALSLRGPCLYYIHTNFSIGQVPLLCALCSAGVCGLAAGVFHPGHARGGQGAALLAAAERVRVQQGPSGLCDQRPARQRQQRRPGAWVRTGGAAAVAGTVASLQIARR